MLRRLAQRKLADYDSFCQQPETRSVKSKLKAQEVRCVQGFGCLRFFAAGNFFTACSKSSSTVRGCESTSVR